MEASNTGCRVENTVVIRMLDELRRTDDLSENFHKEIGHIKKR